jgi:hypothetical protein
MATTMEYTRLKRDMEDWPDTWKGCDADIVVGKRIVKVMLPFVRAMVEEGLASTTIHRHLDHLWLLGGEIIFRLHHDPEVQDLSGDQLLLRFVEEEGGPYSRHVATEAQQRAFDATCRKLYRFLEVR